MLHLPKGNIISVVTDVEVWGSSVIQLGFRPRISIAWEKANSEKRNLDEHNIFKENLTGDFFKPISAKKRSVCFFPIV